MEALKRKILDLEAKLKAKENTIVSSGAVTGITSKSGKALKVSKISHIVGNSPRLRTLGRREDVLLAGSAPDEGLNQQLAWSTSAKTAEYSPAPTIRRAVGVERLRLEPQKNSIASRRRAQAASAQPFDSPMLETFSTIRLKSRSVPCDVISSLMCSRTFYSVPAIQKQLHPPFKTDIEGDWATIGLISERTSPRESSTGSKYILFKLTDLRGSTINLFLFEQAFDQFWKEQVGTVLGVLNPKILVPNEVRS